MHIAGFPPVCGSILVNVCVAIDTTVRTGVIGADVVTFDAAAVFTLPVPADAQGRACDALDQRLVNTAVVLNSVLCKVHGLRAGGKDKSVLSPDAGKLPRESVKLFGREPMNVQPVQIASVSRWVNIHKAEYTFFGIRSQNRGDFFKTFQVEFRGIFI